MSIIDAYSYGGAYNKGSFGILGLRASIAGNTKYSRTPLKLNNL